MREWFNRRAWRARMAARSSRVRIPPSPPSFAKASERQAIKMFFLHRFMKQKGFIHILVIIGIAVIAGLAGYFVLSQRTTPSPARTLPPTLPPSTSVTPTQTPITDSESSRVMVSLGEEFTLKKGETARVKDLNVFLKVKDFIYSPCPRGAQCLWSGLAVVYELTVDGIVYGSSLDNPPRDAPYDVLVKKTDYKTYATFVINKPEVSL